MEYVSCDLCGNGAYKVLWDKAEREKAGTLHGVVIRDGEGNIVQGRNVICTKCGLVYLNPRMSRDELAAFYENDYRKIYGWNLNSALTAELNHARNAYNLLKQHGIGGRLLDVGCSTGRLLEFWDDHAVGLEPNLRNHRIADAAGLDVVCASLEDYEPSEPFDVISMLNMLEHVPSPTEALQKAHTLLKDDGWLLVTVPWLENTRIHRSVDVVQSNAHLYSFTFETLRSLLNKCGFSVRVSVSPVEEIGHKLYVLASKDLFLATRWKIEMQLPAADIERIREHLRRADLVWQWKIQTHEWGFQ